MKKRRRLSAHSISFSLGAFIIYGPESHHCTMCVPGGRLSGTCCVLCCVFSPLWPLGLCFVCDCRSLRTLNFSTVFLSVHSLKFGNDSLELVPSSQEGASISPFLLCPIKKDSRISSRERIPWRTTRTDHRIGKIDGPCWQRTNTTTARKTR